MKIILEGYNKSIHKKNNQLLIKEKEEQIYKISPKKVSDILILGKGYVTFDALTLIAQNNISLISINYYGQIEYILSTPQYENITLRKKQYIISENHQGTQIAKEIITSKIKNQYSTIRTLNRNKQNPEIDKIKEKIKNNLNKIKQLEINENTNIHETKNKIMGIEGQTSVEYWKAIRLLISPTINFKTRQQNPQHDVLNAMLNYGYAMLASEITKIIITQKLDPYCGFLHSDLNNRTSLTYDLIEEFRQQIVDKTVFSLINKKQITEKDIDQRSNLLKKEAKYTLAKKIMDKLETKLNYKKEDTTYIQIIENQVKKLKKSITDNEEYQSFNLYW